MPLEIEVVLVTSISAVEIGAAEVEMSGLEAVVVVDDVVDKVIDDADVVAIEVVAVVDEGDVFDKVVVDDGDVVDIVVVVDEATTSLKSLEVAVTGVTSSLTPARKRQIFSLAEHCSCLSDNLQRIDSILHS